MRKIPILLPTRQFPAIGERTHKEFLFQLKLGLLLALKEKGFLDEAGFHQAEKALKRQCEHPREEKS